MNKRKLESIANNSRRDAIMEKYVAEHGGNFTKGRCGWEYEEPKVINNQVEKFEKRVEKKEKEVMRKLFRKFK